MTTKRKHPARRPVRPVRKCAGVVTSLPEMTTKRKHPARRPVRPALRDHAGARQHERTERLRFRALENAVDPGFRTPRRPFGLFSQGESNAPPSAARGTEVTNRKVRENLCSVSHAC